MSKRRFNKRETGVDSKDAQDNNSSSSNLTSKLERRRRIEDLDEERRLREELSDY